MEEEKYQMIKDKRSESIKAYRIRVDKKKLSELKQLFPSCYDSLVRELDKALSYYELGGLPFNVREYDYFFQSVKKSIKLVNVDYDKIPTNMPEEIKAVLENKKLWDLIDSELDKEIVEEKEARKVIFLVSNMRNVENITKGTDNLIVNALSGTGKDHITEAIFRILPRMEKEELVRTSPKVLSYTRNKTVDPTATWIKTALRLEDVGNNVVNDESFKTFLSANPNKVNYGKVVIKGNPKVLAIEGKPSIIMTIANAVIYDEQLRRLPMLFLDEGIDQSREILKRQALCAKEGLSIEYDSTIKEAIKYLRRVRVKIPYAESLTQMFDKSVGNVIIRTVFNRFLDYIKSSASFYQFQRDKEEDGTIIANQEDFENGCLCLRKTTSNILMIPLSRNDDEIYKVFQKQGVASLSVNELINIPEIQKLGITERWLRARLHFLVSKGFLKMESRDVVGSIKPVNYYSCVSLEEFNVPKFNDLINKTSNRAINTNTSISSNTSNKEYKPSPSNLNHLNNFPSEVPMTINEFEVLEDE